MCGIAGIIDPSLSPIDIRSVLHRMTDVITHRGPDDQGFFLSGKVGLGMRRLSIIDLDGGKQPIFNEDGSVVVVFNGEIYNYRELTRELKSRGHVFSTNSDTEVIVHLYEDLGEDCVDQLRGMFAFAVWDSRNQSLFIARDRLGIKPLYYFLFGESFAFGSEIKAILQHPKVQATLNPEALSYYLSFKYVPAPQTMFTGISALPPAHSLTHNHNGLSVRKYWKLSFINHQVDRKSEKAYAEQLENLLREAVKLRLRSDVPFGAFLSGGVDSSTIVAIMSELLTEPVKTFSVGFEDDNGATDELPYARMVASQFETEHHEIMVGPQDFINLAEKIIWHLDQPLADQATIATYMVSELASRHVKMVLTGEGGDELFAGYARYLGERLSPLFQHLPAAFRSLALALSTRLPGLRRPKIALYALCKTDESARFTNWFPLFNQDMKASLLSADLQRQLVNISSDSIFSEHLHGTDAIEPLNRMLAVDTNLWLPDYLLLRGDKMSMAASIEARLPLLDHKLVEFAATIPPHLKINGLKRKYLLKKVSQTLIPTQIVNRKKQGFPIPISRWFRKEARSFVRDHLSASVIVRRGLFNRHYIERLAKEHEAGFADHSVLLWGLINVELWHRLFIDSQSRPQPAADTLTSLTSVRINTVRHTTA